jgi:alkylation response protein AidB-like acyl-CoA dehydrogenase
MLMHFEADKTLMDAAREIGPLIRKHADEAERERRLSKPVLEALKETGLLKMAIPKSLGGLESDPITRALVVEEVGRHDSAAGWTLENPVDWAFFCARLPDEGAEEIYAKGGDVVIAAQFGRPLAAKKVDGGYNVSGRAPFVSNCLDADWISCTALVDADRHPDREPEMRMVYFPADKCEIIDTWHVMGMRGTGSHDIEVKDVFIPKARTFPMQPDYERGSHYKGPLYRMPLVGAAGTGIPTPMLGVARRALEEVTKVAPDEESGDGDRPSQGALVGSDPAGPGRSDPAFRPLAASAHCERSVAKMSCRGAPLGKPKSRSPARQHARDGERSPGDGARLSHRRNHVDPYVQPPGALLPRHPDHETSRVRVRGPLRNRWTSVSRR